MVVSVLNLISVLLYKIRSFEKIKTFGDYSTLKQKQRYIARCAFGHRHGQQIPDAQSNKCP